MIRAKEKNAFVIPTGKLRFKSDFYKCRQPMQSLISFSQQKQQELKELYAPYHACQACPLGTLGRQRVVFGEGNADAKLMIIGEAPGDQEDQQGRPFVGRSGKLLTQSLLTLGISREEIFISNIVKCRPPNNRKPSSFESKTCKELLLLRQIEIIKPRLICTLGATALAGLIETKEAISKLRGVMICWNSTHLLPTFHPAYVLRNRNQMSIFMSDLQQCRDFITMHHPYMIS